MLKGAGVLPRRLNGMNSFQGFEGKTLERRFAVFDFSFNKNHRKKSRISGFPRAGRFFFSLEGSSLARGDRKDLDICGI
jgi:hypothetical protein